MSDIFIVVTPASNSNGKRRHDRHDAHLRDTGELICSATRQPLLDASRVLLARGYDPKAVISKPINHSPAPTNVGVIATGNVDVAAHDNR
jgi:hypothetical protein